MEKQLCNLDRTNIILNDDFKELLYKTIVFAQDYTSISYLSKLHSYEIYHNLLEKHFIKFYGKKPTQTDNLAFMLLLTYPKEHISRLRKIDDLKLAFNNRSEESDFISKGFTINQGFGEATCICNEDIMYVHIFQNIYSGISIQLGSVCNTRYGLINKNDPAYKSNCIKIKEYKEREKERNEGKPEGYYANEKNDRKREKEEIKLMKIEENITKKNIKILNKEFKKLEKDSPGKFIKTKCIYCKTEYIHNRDTCGPHICSKCCSNERKNMKAQINDKIVATVNKIVATVRTDYCDYCELKHIFNDENELCKICREIVELKKCLICKEQFCIGKNTRDDYCSEECKNKIITCIDCRIDVYRDVARDQEGRCKICYHRFKNKLAVIECIYCRDNFEVPEKDKWRKSCSKCFKENITCYDCISCKKSFKKLPHEEWRKMCTNCYYKSK
jgi:hypothetical protein